MNVLVMRMLKHLDKEAEILDPPMLLQLLELMQSKYAARPSGPDASQLKLSSVYMTCVVRV